MKVRPPGEVLRGRAPVSVLHALAALPAQLPGVRRIAVPARAAGHAIAGSDAVVHDPVVAAAGAGGAGAGAVPGQHLRGGPAVQLHQVPFGAAAVEPGVAEVVPEPVRVGVHPALPAAAGDDLVDAGGGERPWVVHAEP